MHRAAGTALSHCSRVAANRDDERATAYFGISPGFGALGA